MRKEARHADTNITIKKVNYWLTTLVPGKVRGVILKDPFLLTVIILSALFVYIFSAFSVLKMYSLSATGWDLGQDSQMMYNTLHGHLFYSPLLGGSLLAEHWILFAFVVAAVYSIYPSPVTMLILQAIFVAAAVIPLFLLGRSYAERFGVRISRSVNVLLVIICVSYLLSPMTEGLIFFDFHFMAFLPFFFFLALYAFLKRMRLLHIISLAAIVSLHSNFVFIVIALGISEYLMQRIHGESLAVNLPSSIGSGKLRSVILRHWSFFSLLLGSAVLIVYVISASYAKSYLAGSARVNLSLATGESGSYGSVTGLITGIFTDPATVINMLAYDYPTKSAFLLFSFGGTGFTALLSPVVLLASLPYFSYGFISTYSGYYSLGYQYPAMLLPAVFAASAFSVPGVVKFSTSFNRHKRTGRFRKASLAIFSAALIGGCALSLTVDPVNPSPIYLPVGAFSTYHVPSIGESTKVVNFLSTHLNRTSQILTQNNLFPFFSNFPNAVSTPWSPGVNNTTVGNFDFIIGDYASQWALETSHPEPSIAEIVSNDLANKTYGIYAEGGSVIAIKKGYSGVPAYYDPSSQVYNARDLQLENGSISENGTLVKKNDNGSFLWRGPYSTLMPGTYNVTFSLGISNFTPSSYLNLTISSDGGKVILFSRSLLGNLSSIRLSSNFVIGANVTVSTPQYGVEFRGYGNFQGTVYFKQVSVQQISW